MNAQKVKTVIDVRSEGEFLSGSAEGAINIPLDRFSNHIEEIKNIDGTIILCCASGNRSGMAKHILESHGIDSYNAGGWNQVAQFEIN
jgi:phage shock protein E